MITAYLSAPRQFTIEEVPTPEPGPGEVLLRLAYNAVCGSEHAPYLGFATGFPLYLREVKYPRQVGHEPSAVIAKLGPGVTGFGVGQPVVPIAGRFGTHAIAKITEITPIPEGVSLRDASLTLMAQETYYLCSEMLHITSEDRVLIIGMGPFGMLTLEHIRETGCRSIIAADLNAGRLVMARELGATATVNAGEMDLVQAVVGLGPKPNVVIEASGQPQPIKQAIRVAAPYGRVVLAARSTHPLQDFTVEDVFHSFLTVSGGKIPPKAYRQRYTALTLDLIKQNKIHADRLITHEFPLARIGEAFEVATHPGAGGMKVVVNSMEA